MLSLNRTFYGIETIGCEGHWSYFVSVLIVPFMELKLVTVTHNRVIPRS